MTEVIAPGRVSGTVAAPPSKSHLQRALAIASLAAGRSVVRGYRSSADVDAVIGIIRELGAQVEVAGDTVTVISEGGMPGRPVTVNCGESGLASRMFSAVAALSEHEVIIVGKGSLLKRPLAMVQDALSQMGKSVTLHDGLLPMKLNGKMAPSEICIDGSQSSQLLTGLLIALPMLDGRSVVHVDGLRSREYVQLTLDTLAQFGVQIIHRDFGTFIIDGKQRPRPTTLTAEGDWSGAAFLLAAGAIAGSVTVTGLDPLSSQPDRAILDVLGLVGARIEISENGITVARDRMRPFNFDAADCPDLFPPLAALAANSAGWCSISGVHRLRHKESDRAATVMDTLGRAGIRATIEGDVMRILGGKAESCTISSHNDHRIAMMAAVLALNGLGKITVTGAEAVAKSYPGFFTDLASLAVGRGR